jgi:hypothetical protein
MTLSDCDNSETKHLGYNTLVSLMSGSIQALIDAVGYEEAFRHLEPHIQLNARFIIARFPEEIGIHISDCESVAKLILYCISLSGRGDPSFEVGPESATLFQQRCRNNGQFPNMCEWWCRREWEHIIEEGCPSMVLRQIASKDRGDDICIWKIERRNPGGGTDEQVPVPNPVFSMERLDFWANAGPSEYWNNSSQVTLELIGEERGGRLLCKYSRMQGVAFGEYCLSTLNAKRGMDLLIKSVDLGDKIWEVKSEWSKKAPNRLEREVRECPFSGATISPCDQVEAYWKGVCSVVAPNWETSYERRMTQGAERCKLVFSQIKGEGLDVGSEEPADPLAALKLRFVKGEISKDEYREMRDVLLEK